MLISLLLRSFSRAAFPSPVKIAQVTCLAANYQVCITWICCWKRRSVIHPFAHLQYFHFNNCNKCIVKMRLDDSVTYW